MMARTLYEERVYNPRWLIALLAIIAIGGAAIAVYLALAPEVPMAPVVALSLVALVVAYLAYALRWFEVRIDEAGLAYGWAGFPSGRIARRDIASAEVRRYPWWYGYGWRVVGRNVCYSIPFGSQALLVTRRSGFYDRYWFTLKGAAQAADILTRG